MKTSEIIRIKIEADEGKILTDGVFYGKVIYLAEDRTPDEFHEIPETEYEKILAEQESEAP